MPDELDSETVLRQRLVATFTFQTFHHKRKSNGEQGKFDRAMQLAKDILTVAIITTCDRTCAASMVLKDVPYVPDGKKLRLAVTYIKYIIIFIMF
jgi:hypothetical protein